MSSDPVSDEAWQSLRTAVEAYADASVERWRNDGPDFLSFRTHSELTFATHVADDAVRSPYAQHPVRGATGVEVKLRETETAATAYEALTDLPQVYGVGDRSPSEKRIVETVDGLADTIRVNPSLRRALVRTIWGTYAATLSDASEDGPLADSTLAALSLRTAFAQYMTAEKKLELASLAEGIQPDDVQEFIRHVRADVEATHRWFTVTALLNAPIADLTTSHLVWEGRWHERPCFLGIAYPSDATCQAVLKAAGHTHIPWNSGIGHINCLLRFTYALPTDQESEETNGDHYLAAEYVKRAVDLLRANSAGDVGILHLVVGVEPLGGNRLRIPVFAQFREGRAAIQRVPLRGVYDPPDPADLIAEAQIKELGTLFGAYAVEGVQIPGLPVAMDRLRTIYERYAPDELGRLVDAVTGLEALYLADAQTTEIGYRLQVRIAKMLGSSLTSSGRVQLAQQVKKIYDVRSTLVHKGEPNQKLRGKTSELEAAAVQLLKKSINVFLSERFGEGSSPDQLGELWLKMILGDSPTTPVDSPTTPDDAQVPLASESRSTSGETHNAP
jgi:hypothetical protein